MDAQHPLLVDDPAKLDNLFADLGVAMGEPAGALQRAGHRSYVFGFDDV